MKPYFERVTEMWLFLIFLACSSLAAITYIAQDLGNMDKIVVMWWAVSGPLVFLFFLIRKRYVIKVKPI